VLCCAVLCCAVLCCAVLCCAVLCCAVLCCAVLCCAVLCCAVLCCAVLCCDMVLHLSSWLPSMMSTEHGTSALGTFGVAHNLALGRKLAVGCCAVLAVAAAPLITPLIGMFVSYTA